MICTPVLVGSHLEERAFEAQWNAQLVHCSVDAKCERQEIDITHEQFTKWSVGDYYPTVDEYGGIRSRG